MQISQGIVIFAKYNTDDTPVWVNATGPTDVKNVYLQIVDMAVAPAGTQLYIVGA